MQTRAEAAAAERRRLMDATLRLPEGIELNANDISIERIEQPGRAEREDIASDETMILNLGPQHPSTHGVLRIMVELDGETVLRAKPVIGYLHTGMEKTAETLSFVQGGTNVTRMDYLSPFHNECVFSLATEQLLGVDVPERATWIRMLVLELNRISSHLMFIASNGADLGAISMLLYGWRERELVLAFFEKTTGLRMNHHYIRPGGVAADLPPGWKADVLAICDEIMRRCDEYDTLQTFQPIFQERTKGVAVLSPEDAIALSASGPVLRGSGIEWDLRRDMPYLFYEHVGFNVIVGTNGDAFDRFAVRLNEMRESVSIIRQIVKQMPSGDVRSQDAKLTPPPRNRIDESMEALIHHFKLFTEGFKVPAGETYVAIESPRGELGCHLVSDGSARPYRMHMRTPSFVNLQSLPTMMKGGLIADAIASISSIDPVLGDVDR